MRYIELTTSEKGTLEQGHKNHPKFHLRERFHSTLLSNEGCWQVKEIADLYQTRTRTIYTWRIGGSTKAWSDYSFYPVEVLSYFCL